MNDPGAGTNHAGWTTGWGVTMRLRLFCIVAACGATGLFVPAAAAHTDSDVVAVPAGEVAEVGLEPTHGCDGSPTVKVSTRVPVAGASGEEVQGWTVSAKDDGQGHTVVEWSGGSLPADQTGTFPVSFTAPDTPGTLLTFPFIQQCANGQELAWIDGDPAAELPAPRILVLPAGSEPAATIDDVPPDAPGRDQLAAIVDVDNPAQPSTTTTAATSTSTTAADTPATTTTAPDATAEDTSEAKDDDGTNVLPFVIAGVAVVALAGGAYAYSRSRSRA